MPSGSTAVAVHVLSQLSHSGSTYSLLGFCSSAACPGRAASILRKPRSKSVLPFWAVSARISPITLQNLKPCPEQAEQISTCMPAVVCMLL